MLSLLLSIPPGADFAITYFYTEASTLTHTLWLQQCTRDKCSCSAEMRSNLFSVFFQLLEQSLVVGTTDSSVCQRIPSVTSSIGLTIP